MDTQTHITAIAHTIQIAVAPVFLLGGVGAMLGVLSSRLSRIVDRARVLEAELADAAEQRRKVLRKGLRAQARRARLTNLAIAFCIGCALLIASAIIVLFAGAFSRWDLSIVIAVLFVGSILSLICGLFCFLKEIQLATRYLRIGEPEPGAVVPAAAAVKPVAGRHPP